MRFLNRWYSYSGESPSLRPYSSLYQYPDSPLQRTALVLLLEVDQAGVNRFVEEVKARLGRKFDRFIVVLTASDFSACRRQGLVVEHFPAARSARALLPHHDWRRYLAQRYEIVIAKWSPDWILSYGEELSTYLNRFEVNT